MKSLISKMNKALATVFIAGIGGFAQEVETSENREKNPLRNKRNYKTSWTLKKELTTNPYGSLSEKSVSRNYKTKYSTKQEMVIEIPRGKAVRKNYKRPH